MRQLVRGAIVALLGISLTTCAAPAPRRPPPNAPSPIASAVRTAEPKETRGPLLEAGEPIEDAFATIDELARTGVEQGKMPGCVVVVGRRDEVLFRRAYGAAALQPERIAMQPETLFDLASLTKAVATSTSIAVLVDRGKVDLDAPAAKYVPELKKLPTFTVRQLLLHTSGLPAATPMTDWTTDRAFVVRRIGELTLKSRPGERFLYSDVGFVVLEEIVRRVSGTELSEFARREIFEPLGMTETTFRPEGALRARAAPTEQRDGAWMKGDVHDPRAWALGGVAGHAGLFSTADDLARFARAMLQRGSLDGNRLYSEKTFETFTTRRETSKGGRALGWDVDSTFATHKSPLLSAKAFGHGGFTGTAMWIDPENDFFVVFLSNRVHPDGKGAVNALVAEIASAAVRATTVETGIDVLRAEGFERLRGARIALVTNERAKARDGTSTIDVLRSAPGVTLAALFAPEHGIGAEREGAIADSSRGGVPVYGLYGERFAPTASMLDGVDTIVFDLQDAGARFYTYASTMKRALKVAAERRLRFVVLDRPNPIDGVDVEGPVLPADGASTFVNHHPLPVRHGMTMGELARLFVADEQLDVKLDVVKMKHWRRQDYFDRTRLAWVAPSPNLRTVAEAVLYPAVALFEASNVSVGRGTDTPFEVIGAPWLDGAALAKKLAGAVDGLSFEPTTFTPRAAVHAGKPCKGVRIRVTDRARFSPVRSGLAIARALYELHATEWESDKLDRLLQWKPALEALRDGKSVSEIEATWSEDLAAFRAKRSKFLLYR